jgi:predicted acylesterase/phospholipase RssA
MKLLSISGGATDIPVLAGCAISLLKSYKADAFAGVSSGAILAFALGANKHKEVEELVKNFSHNDIFGISPFGAKGGVSFAAAMRVVLGKPSLGTMDNLRKTLKKVVSKADFAAIQSNIYVGAVDIHAGHQKLFLLNEMSYTEAIDAVVASASIPLIAEPVNIYGDYYLDGGILDHNIANKLIENINFDAVRTIYVRDAETVLDKLSFFSILKKIAALGIKEISISDQKIEAEICARKNIDYKCYNLKGVMESLFDTNSDRLLKGWCYGYAEGSR